MTNNLSKILGIGAIALGTLTSSSCDQNPENSSKEEDNACETYQGHSGLPNRHSGEYLYTFDPFHKDARSNDPNYILIGNARFEKEMNIGEKYCFEIKEDSPWNRLDSFSPAEDNPQNNNYSPDSNSWGENSYGK
ncbi:MAG: hypothetical protein WDZ69_00530 [Candidatus Pacearchaeota archaeon]